MYKNKYVMVTGASSGIGKSISEYLLSLGANVIMIARSLEKLEKIAKKGWEGEAFYYQYDLCNLESIKQIFDYCKEQNIKLDGIVHCAGLTANMPLRVSNVETVSQVLRVNLEAFIQICKYAASKKYTKDNASIVALSSTASIRGGKGLSVYSASKAAINIFVKSAAMELSHRGIRINAIAPAMVETEMYHETKREIPGIENAVLSNQSLGVIEPVYIAYLAEFLLSDKSKYISGETIVVGAGGNF